MRISTALETRQFGREKSGFGQRIAVGLKAAWHEVELWRETRRLMAMDPAIFKDIAVPQGGVEWAVRNGRDDRPLGRVDHHSPG
jgi:hypothetical protein